MNRLQQPLAHLESRLVPDGRFIVIADDGTEDLEARVDRCRAAIGRSPKDVFVICNHFPDLLGPAEPGEHEPWVVMEITST